jgi:hypothetical protein
VGHSQAAQALPLTPVEDSLMDPAEIDNRFSFHPATEETGPKHDAVRELCRSTAHRLNELLPDSREKSTAITKLDEVMMHANAAIARNQGD